MGQYKGTANRDTTTVSPGGGANSAPPALRAIRALLVAPRVLKMYPRGHQRAVAQAADLATLFAQMIRAHDGACTLLVQEMKIAVNGDVLTDFVELTTGLALLMRQRRIRAITFRSGITPEEIEDLIELLAGDQQELLANGGPEAFLADRDCCHLDVEALSLEDGTGALPPNVTEALEQSYASHETFDRMSRLRETLEGHDDAAAAEVAETFDHLLTVFFSDPIWKDLTADQIREAFHNFVGLLEHALRSGDGGEQVTARIASLKSLFSGLSPRDLLGGERQQTTSFNGSVDYQVTDVQPQLETGLDATAHDTLRNEFETHQHTANALLVLADTLFSISSAEEYHRARAAFLSALADERFDDAAVAFLVDYASFQTPEPVHETHVSLLRAIIRGVARESALMLALSLREHDHPGLEPLIDRLAASQDRFALLARAARLALSDEARALILAALANQVNARPQAFVVWAHEAPDDLFIRGLLGAILGRCRVAVDAVCVDLFRKGAPRHRTALIRYLQGHGSSRALGLLALGLPTDDSPVDPELLSAISRVRQPEAVRVMRKLVDRFNRKRRRIREIMPVLLHLHRMQAVEARDFFWEIVTRRGRYFPHYRWRLRRVVRKLIEGKL